MSLRRETRQIISELIARELPKNRLPNGEYDRRATATAVLSWMRVDHAWASKEVEAAAVSELYGRLVDRFIEGDKSDFSLVDKLNRAATKRGKKQRQYLRGFVYFINVDGLPVTKRRIELKKEELPLVVKYLTKLRATYDREITWYQHIYEQMTFAGMADDAVISSIVREERVA